MIKRMSFYVIGLLVTTLGIALVIFSSVGVGPWDSVFVGFNIQLGLTVGTWSIIIQILIVLFNSYLLKEPIEYKSAIAIILRGIFLDFWLIVVFPNITFENFNFLVQWSVFFIGVLLEGVGIAFYMIVNLPLMPIDKTMKALSGKFNLSIQFSRIIIEFFAIVVAFLLRGPVGIGTLFLGVVLGPTVHFFHKYSKKIYNDI